MSISSIGRVSLANVQSEFGGLAPISMSEYYAGGAYVVAGISGASGLVPSSGRISVGNFRGTISVTGPGNYSLVANVSSVDPSSTILFTANSVAQSQLLYYTVEPFDNVDLALSVVPTTIEVGQNATFTWSTINADTVTWALNGSSQGALALNGTVTTPAFGSTGSFVVAVTASNLAVPSGNTVTKSVTLTVNPSSSTTTTTTTQAPTSGNASLYTSGTGSGLVVLPGANLGTSAVYVAFRLLGAGGGGGGGDFSSTGGSGGSGTAAVGIVQLPATAGNKILVGGVGNGGGRAGSDVAVLPPGNLSSQNGTGGLGYSFPVLSAGYAGSGGAGALAGTQNRSGAGGGGGGATALGYYVEGSSLIIPIAAVGGGGGGGGGSDQVTAGGGAGQIGTTSIGNVSVLSTQVGTTAVRLSNDGGGGGGGGGGAGIAGLGGTDLVAGGGGGSTGQILQNTTSTLSPANWTSFDVYRASANPILISEAAAGDRGFYGRGGLGGTQFLVSDSGSNGAIQVYWTNAGLPNVNQIQALPDPDITVTIPNGVTVIANGTTAYIEFYRNGTIENNDTALARSRLQWTPNFFSSWSGVFYEMYVTADTTSSGGNFTGTTSTWISLNREPNNPVRYQLTSGLSTYSATLTVRIRQVGTLTDLSVETITLQTNPYSE